MRLFVLSFLLVAATGAQAADSLAPGDPEAGARVFTRCATCHRIGPDAVNYVGPVLNGVVGRKAGTYPGYDYSPANKASGIVWDEATLAAYLPDPRAYLHGTYMNFVGLKKPQDVANVIAYLKTFDAKGNPAKP
jgi:cytochrome c